MFCNECGEENRNDRKFCLNCGARLRDYTKPRENLLMPEDIVKQQEKVTKKNKVSKVCNLLLSIFFMLAVVFTILLFALPKAVETIFIILSLIFDVAFIVTCIVKSSLLKKISKK